MQILATYKTKIIDGRVKPLRNVTRGHMNMPVLRAHSKYSGISNSDMMPGAVARLLRNAAIGGEWFDLTALPECIRVTPDKSGFMARVELLG